MNATSTPVPIYDRPSESFQSFSSPLTPRNASVESSPFKFPPHTNKQLLVNTMNYFSNLETHPLAWSREKLFRRRGVETISTGTLSTMQFVIVSPVLNPLSGKVNVNYRRSGGKIFKMKIQKTIQLLPRRDDTVARHRVQ